MKKHIVFDFCGVYLNCSSLGFKPVPEIESVIEKLAKANFFVYGFSNMSLNTLSQLKLKYKSLSLFKNIVVSDMLTKPKPDSESFIEFLSLNDLSINDIVFIDDSDYNIKSAERLVIISIHYTNINNLLQMLKDKANVIF